MKLFLSSCALVALVVAGNASAQTNGIATVSPDVAILSAKAFAAANGTIGTTYKAQLDQAATQDQTLNTQIRTLIDANKDGQISQTELQTGQNPSTPVGAQVKAAQDRAQPAIEQLRQPAVLAQAYALEQVAMKYDAALQTVARQKNANIVLTPQAIEYAPPATDITQAVTTELDRVAPTVPITPPANWQPSQTTVQLLNQYRQAVYASELRRQQAAQQGGTAAVPTPSATGGAPATAHRNTRARPSHGWPVNDSRGGGRRNDRARYRAGHGGAAPSLSHAAGRSGRGACPRPVGSPPSRRSRSTKASSRAIFPVARSCPES